MKHAARLVLTHLYALSARPRVAQRLALGLHSKLLAAVMAPVMALLLAFGSSGVRADASADISSLVQALRLDEALAQADAYLASHPQDAPMRFLKAQVLDAQGNSALALATYTQLTLDFPELPEPYNNLAVLYARQGALEAARSALEAALRVHPGYATARENLGDVYLQLAAQAYAQTLQSDPGRQATVAPKRARLQAALDALAPQPKRQ